MTSVIAIFASNTEAESPQLGASDRAAIGFAVSKFGGCATGYHPLGDQFAQNYGMAASLPKVEALSPSQLPTFDIAFIGQDALDELGENLAGALAESATATLLFDVLDVAPIGDQLRIIKDIGYGSREELLVRGPVVMVVSAAATRPPYVSRYRRLMAMRNGLNNEALQPAAYTAPVKDWEVARPRVKVNLQALSHTGSAEDRMSAAFGISTTNAADANDRIIVADAATCARHLIRYLAHNHFLPASSTDAFHHQEDKLLSLPQSKAQATSNVARDKSTTLPPTRTPKSVGDTPQRLSRRPRNVESRSESTRDLQTNPSNQNPSEHRYPQPVGRALTGLARRPRKLGD